MIWGIFKRRNYGIEIQEVIFVYFQPIVSYEIHNFTLSEIQHGEESQ
jgi:hypothetical protein